MPDVFEGLAVGACVLALLFGIRLLVRTALEIGAPRPPRRFWRSPE
jgi:hypothetical protein